MVLKRAKVCCGKIPEVWSDEGCLFPDCCFGVSADMSLCWVTAELSLQPWGLEICNGKQVLTSSSRGPSGEGMMYEPHKITIWEPEGKGWNNVRMIKVWWHANIYVHHKATSQQTVSLGRNPSELMNSALPLDFFLHLQGQSQPMGESNKRWGSLYMDACPVPSSWDLRFTPCEDWWLNSRSRLL